LSTVATPARTVQEQNTMKQTVLFLTLAVLAACETTGASRPAPEPEPKQSGISISGYARVGASTEF